MKVTNVWVLENILDFFFLLLFELFTQNSVWFYSQDFTHILVCLCVR